MDPSFGPNKTCRVVGGRSVSGHPDGGEKESVRVGAWRSLSWFDGKGASDPAVQPAASPRQISRVIAEAAKARINAAICEQQRRPLPLVRRVEVESRSIGESIRRGHDRRRHLIGQTAQIEGVKFVLL